MQFESVRNYPHIIPKACLPSRTSLAHGPGLANQAEGPLPGGGGPRSGKQLRGGGRLPLCIQAILSSKRGATRNQTDHVATFRGNQQSKQAGGKRLGRGGGRRHGGEGEFVC